MDTLPDVGTHVRIVSPDNYNGRVGKVLSHDHRGQHGIYTVLVDVKCLWPVWFAPHELELDLPDEIPHAEPTSDFDLLKRMVRTKGQPNPIADLIDERIEQNLKWGEQNHPDGTGTGANEAAMQKRLNDHAVSEDRLTWRGILFEEVLEAFAEKDPARLREELIQVAAVAVAWCEAIDRRVSA